MSNDKIILLGGLYNIEQTQFGNQYQGAIITEDSKVLNYCNSSSLDWAKNDLGVRNFTNSDGPTERCKGEQDDISRELGHSNWIILWSNDDWLPSEVLDKVKIGVTDYQQKVRNRLASEYKSRKSSEVKN